MAFEVKLDMRDFGNSVIVLCLRYHGGVQNTTLEYDEAGSLVAEDPTLHLFMGHPIKASDEFEEMRRLGPKLSRAQVSWMRHLEEHLDQGKEFCLCR